MVHDDFSLCTLRLLTSTTFDEFALSASDFLAFLFKHNDSTRSRFIRDSKLLGSRDNDL
jgi:hypothetical protein